MAGWWEGRQWVRMSRLQSKLRRVTRRRSTDGHQDDGLSVGRWILLGQSATAELSHGATATLIVPTGHKMSLTAPSDRAYKRPCL